MEEALDAVSIFAHSGPMALLQEWVASELPGTSSALFQRLPGPSFEAHLLGRLLMRSASRKFSG